MELQRRRMECWCSGMLQTSVFPAQGERNAHSMQIWDLFEGRTLFSGQDPDGKGYSTRAHLAEMIGLLGPPPADLIKRGKRSPEFFDDQGQWLRSFLQGDLQAKLGFPGHWNNTVPIPFSTSLEKLEENLEGKRKELFVKFLSSMLQWLPEHRKTAKELLNDPWLNDRIE